MFGSNNCKFVGRFTKSPKETLKKLDNGSSFLSISIAVKTEAFDKEGQPYVRTDYPQVNLWNEQAEIVARDFDKGSKVEVSATVQTRRYKAEYGDSWRYATEFLVQSIQNAPFTPETETAEPSAELQAVSAVTDEGVPAQDETSPKPKTAPKGSKSRRKTAARK